MRRKSHVRFCSGGGVGDHPTDRNPSFDFAQDRLRRLRRSRSGSREVLRRSRGETRPVRTPVRNRHSALDDPPQLSVLRAAGQHPGRPAQRRLEPAGIHRGAGLLPEPADAAAVAGRTGLVLRRRGGKAYRVLAWAYLITLVLLLVTDGRVYYLAPVYPALFAGGAVAIEGWTGRRGWGWLKPVYLAALIASGLILAPFWLPLLPPQTYIRYAKAVPLGQPALENDPTGALPLLFADRFGWPEQVQAVAQAYRALPPDVRAKTAIWGNSYQQAGAVDFFGPALGLPKAIGGHLNYWYWGPRGYTGESVLTLGEKLGDLSPLFAKCEQVGAVSHPYAMPRQRFPIYWCQGMKQSLQELWPQVKKWD